MNSLPPAPADTRVQIWAQAEDKIIEMHGRLFDTVCTTCGKRERNVRISPICEGLRGTEGETEKNDRRVPLGDLPRCQVINQDGQICGGLLRPGVVWFHEQPMRAEEIENTVEETDFMLVAGSSCMVGELYLIFLFGFLTSP